MRLWFLAMLFVTATGSKAVVSHHKNVFLSPPRGGANTSTDAVLLGNGSLGAAISGPAENLKLWLNRNDFWRLQNAYNRCTPRSFGGVNIKTPALQGASYRIEQDLYTAVTTGTFSGKGTVLHVASFVAATADLLVVRLEAGGDVPLDVEITPWLADRDSENAMGSDGDIRWMTRRFSKSVDIPTAAAAALRLLGAAAWSFRLQPGKPVTLVAAMDSMFRSKDFLAQAKRLAARLNPERIQELLDAHKTWWAGYWAKSWVEIPDKVIEKEYYRSLYILGSCSRDPRFPPPIFGTWNLTETPAWAGDYHMNYNHVAPFYGLYGANRVEQADPEDAPILDFMPRGRKYARELYGTRGVVYPVGIGPRGMDSTYGNKSHGRNVEKGVLLFGQKSNAAYCIVNMAQRWGMTRDLEYARKVYPFFREVADFWEDYLKYEKGPDGSMRYVITGDAIHEGSGRDVNPILSLGLVRLLMNTVLELSESLDVDAGRRAKWSEIHDRLSRFPTQEMKGKTVFRYSERGTSWWKNNTLGIQHIYPAGAIHLDSDPELLEVARNTIDVMQRWNDFNGTNSFYPAAVRVGYDPETILEHLHAWASGKRPNGLKHGNNPHGIELCTPAIATIDMMLCMSYGGVIRVFRVWPQHLDARFADLRCYGAFLVSSALEDEEVRYVRVRSEKGQLCTVESPWPGRKVTVYRDGRRAETLSGKRLRFTTRPGETVLLSAAPPRGREIFVDGRSTASRADGSRQAPLRTIEAGLESAAPGDSVVVRGGVYRESIRVPSGTPERPLVLKAAPGERVILSGAVPVGPFKKAHGNTYVSALDFRPGRLLARRRPQPVAREPNEGWWTAAAAGELTIDDPGHLTALRSSVDGARAYIWTTHGNTFFTAAVTSLDTSRGRLAVARPSRWMRLGAGDRYFLQNHPDMIDSPGEWAVKEAGGNKTGFEVYFRPVEVSDLEDVEAPHEKRRVLLVSDACNVRIEGLEVTASARCGIEVNKSREVTVTGCTVHNNGYAGIALRDCRNVAIRGNISWNNGSGITLHTVTGATVEENDVGYNRVDGVIVSWNSSDITVRRNYIHHHLLWGHPDNLQVYRGVKNVRFIKNLLMAGGQSIMAEETSGGVLEGNMIIACGAYSVILGHGNAAGYRIHNNTVAFSGYGCLSLTARDYDVRENIFVTGHGGIVYGVRGIKGYTSARNLFFKAPELPEDGVLASDKAWNQSIEDFQESTGQESGSLYGDPCFRGAPVAFGVLDARRLSECTRDTWYLRRGSGAFAPGDIVEVDLDGTARRVTAVKGDEIKVSPGLAASPLKGCLVCNWGNNGRLEWDLRLRPESAAARLSASGGPIGSRIDVAAYRRGDFDADGKRDLPPLPRELDPAQPGGS